MYAEKTVPKIWTDFGRHARRYAVTSNCIQLRGQSTVPPTPTVIPSSSRQRLGNCCFKLSDCGEQEPPWDPLPVSVKTLLSQLLGKQGPKGAGSISSKKNDKIQPGAHAASRGTATLHGRTRAQTPSANPKYIWKVNAAHGVCACGVTWPCPCLCVAFLPQREGAPRVLPFRHGAGGAVRGASCHARRRISAPLLPHALCRCRLLSVS